MTDAQSSVDAAHSPPQNGATGPYVLRKLDVDFALSEDGSENDIYITCVDFWGEFEIVNDCLYCDGADQLYSDGNLYVGTSAAEILHYFLLPPADAADTSQQFILATRLQPQYSDNTPAAQRVGIQQILILPTVNKACVLCNGTLTFYTLPELSPIFTNTKLNNCLWAGGVDQGGIEDGEDNQDGIVIMICQKSRTRLIRIGERLQRVREIEAGGYLDTIRRGSIACVADTKAYHLLDVVERQRIPLFEISSSGGDASSSNPTPSSTSDSTKEFATSSATTPPVEGASHSERGHSRDTSNSSTPQRVMSPQPPASAILTSQLPERRDSLRPPLDATKEHSRSSSQDVLKLRAKTTLLPHIASASSSEFLLTTGSSFEDPGVGLFVNTDGDVVRGTLEFSRYPESLCIDTPEVEAEVGGDITTEQDQFALALVTRDQCKQLEIQSLDQEDDTVNSGKFWLPIADAGTNVEEHVGNTKNAFGVRPATSYLGSISPIIGELLGLKRLDINFASEQQTASSTESREKQEAQFINRLSSIRSHILVWGIDKVWWASRNPAIVRLHARLQGATATSTVKPGSNALDRKAIEEILADIEGEEPTTELEFLTITSVKQQSSLLLFLDLVRQSLENAQLSPRDLETTEKALSDGDVDPRLLLLVMPLLRKEVIQGPEGIWIQGAVKTLLNDFLRKQDLSQTHDTTASGFDLLQLIRRYLFIWRRKKGFGSVTNEKEVFETVDAALLHVLLILDQNSRRGPGRRGSLRSELNTVVDHGVDCFDRAVELLEQFKRLYVLSRLYQSRKMSSKVLNTWKRILEGEEDTGGELTDGEQEMRRYLTVLNDAAVVEEYATWLAARNPKLGVRVFADGNKVRFEPKHAVAILKEHAPNAVKDYLEYLVFDKNVSSPTYTLCRPSQLTHHISLLSMPQI